MHALRLMAAEFGEAAGDEGGVAAEAEAGVGSRTLISPRFLDFQRILLNLHARCKFTLHHLS